MTLFDNDEQEQNQYRAAVKESNWFKNEIVDARLAGFAVGGLVCFGLFAILEFFIR